MVAFRDDMRGIMNIMNQDLVIVLIGYARGLVTLEQIKEWLAENVWELSRSPSPLDRMILGELELALAEYDRGDRDERYVKRAVATLLVLPNPILVPKLEIFRVQPALGLALA